MINRDGGSWHFDWERTSDGYRAWVVSARHISVTGKTWRSTQAAIYARVDCELHAGEWEAKWITAPPFEEDPRCWVDPDFVRLRGSGSHYTYNDEHALYSGGVCDRCGKATGIRNDVQVVYGTRDLGEFSTSFLGRGPLLIRSETADAIGHDRLACESLRPTTRIGQGRVSFLEPVLACLIPPMAIKPPADLSGRRCPSCGWSAFSHRFNQNEYYDFAAASTIPRAAESFWFGRANFASLCVRRDWWDSISRIPALRGIGIDALIVAPDAEVDAQPPLNEVGPGSRIKEREFFLRRMRAHLESVKDWPPRAIAGWVFEDEGEKPKKTRPLADP